MSTIGKVTGFKIAKNMEGDSDRLILQVETLEGEDVRSIELFNQAGEDTNPANGCRIYIIDASSRYQIGVTIILQIAISEPIAPSSVNKALLKSSAELLEGGFFKISVVKSVYVDILVE